MNRVFISNYLYKIVIVQRQSLYFKRIRATALTTCHAAAIDQLKKIQISCNGTAAQLQPRIFEDLSDIGCLSM